MTDFMHFLPGYLLRYPAAYLPEYLPEYRVVLRGLFAWGCHSGAKCAGLDRYVNERWAHSGNGFGHWH